MKRPNIIFFNPDQMRADSLHHLGNKAAYTPNYDKLANEGVSFSNCFCQNPVCVPSRASFMTGLYPHTNGHRTMTYLLRPNENNLLKEMKKSGYYVWASGRGDTLAGQDKKWLDECMDECANVIGDFAKDTAEPRGNKDDDTYFSFYQGVIRTDKKDGISQDNDYAYTKAAVHRIKNRPSDKPLFMYIALNNPHPPYKIEQKFIDLIDIDKLPKRIPSLSNGSNKPSMEKGLKENLGVSNWSEDRFDKLRAVYLAMVAKTDYLLGQVITALKDEGIYDDTIIFVYSDHGDYTGDFGIVEKAQNCFPDCLTNVPLIIKAQKGYSKSNEINNSLVELLDIYATAQEFAGNIPDHDNFSISLCDMIKGNKNSHRDFVFCEGGRLHGETQCMESIGKKTIGISDMYNPRISLQESENAEHTKATMIRTADYKYIKRLYESDEFYFLKEGEEKNQIDNPKYKDKISDLQNKMLTWYMETCDTVPRDYDQRFSNDFYVSAAAATGLPKIAVGVFSAYMKIFHKTFDQTIAQFAPFAEKFKNINK